MDWFTKAINLIKFQRGDFVWGKMKGFSFWPAMVLDAIDCGKKDSNPKKCWLFWFGDHSISQISKDKISPFNLNFTENFLHCTKKDFVKSVEEALLILAAANDLKFDDTTSLVNWAKHGFQSNWPVNFQWPKIDLPQIVQDALSKDSESSQESDTEDEVEKIIKKVLNNEKSIEEICIGCCRETYSLVQSHPLFYGKVCMKCKKDVDRINKFPPGYHQKYCIICGQGGTLVFCCKKMCRRAYCEECITYLDSKSSFKKITSIEDWECYLCEPARRKNCLIRRRVMKRKTEDEESPISKTARHDLTHIKVEKSDLEQTVKNELDPVSKSASRSAVNSTINIVIRDLLNGKKTLEDICIACCEENVELKIDHPLFMGKVCTKCVKDVKKICKLPPRKFYNHCIVCGQGGCLVYCSSRQCFRAYCGPCIEYLDAGKVAYMKIIEQDDWLCYFCKPNPNKRCFIRRRDTNRDEMVTNSVPTPKIKLESGFGKTKAAPTSDNSTKRRIFVNCSTPSTSYPIASTSARPTEAEESANSKQIGNVIDDVLKRIKKLKADPSCDESKNGEETENYPPPSDISTSETIKAIDDVLKGIKRLRGVLNNSHDNL